MKDFFKYWLTNEFVPLYIILGAIAAVFFYVGTEAPFLVGVLLFILFGAITYVLAGKFVKIVKFAEELQFKSGERDMIIRYLEDGVVIYDPNFKVLTFNATAEKIFGLTAVEVVGKQFDPGAAKSPRFRVFAQTLFPSLAPSMTPRSEPDHWPQVIELSFDTPKLELRVTLHQIKDEKGVVIGFIKIVHDVTREKGLLQAKTDFIGVAAHQLRTPLTALHWAVESILKLAENNADIKPIAEEALMVSERSLKITNDLLDVSKIEEGKFGYSFQPANLVDFAANIAKETKTLAAQYSITVEFVPPPAPLPEVTIDQNRLSSVLFNLIDNAIRYNTKNGRVTVSVAPDQKPGFARISVADTGIGISPEDLKNLFQKLYRGSNAAQVEPNGTGIGLYIAKNIVHRHGGEIGVSSELNRGSTFWFTVPLDPTLIPKTDTSAGVI